MKRVDPLLTNVSASLPAGAGTHFSEAELVELEARFPDGVSTQEIVELFSTRGERLTEATFRKYVQLGLLPRSVRVGRKGKHRGSQGRYPAGVVRQIEAVRALMAQGYTIQDIQREFVNLRGDIDALARQLSQVLTTLDQAIGVNRHGRRRGVGPCAGGCQAERRHAGRQIARDRKAVGYARTHGQGCRLAQGHVRAVR